MRLNLNFKSQRFFSWLLLSLLGLIWGSSFLSIKIALISFQATQIASLRIIIGSLILSIVSLFFNINVFNWRKPRGYWISCLGVAFLSNAFPFTLLAIAQEHLSSVFVGLCMATIPLITLLLTYLLLTNEQITIKKILGILLGISGTAILIMSRKGLMNNPFSLANIYVWLCVLAPFCYAMGAIVIRKSNPSDYLEFSTHCLLIASLICIPNLIFLGSFPPNPNIKSILAILYLGLFPTGIATIILVTIIKNYGTIFLSLVNFKVPLWSTIFGLLVLGEDLPNNFSTSFILILIGILVCQMENRND